jgi:hypothetical protein
MSASSPAATLLLQAQIGDHVEVGLVPTIG